VTTRFTIDRGRASRVGVPRSSVSKEPVADEEFAAIMAAVHRLAPPEIRDWIAQLAIRMRATEPRVCRSIRRVLERGFP
jgi:hypothetical protein